MIEFVITITSLLIGYYLGSKRELKRDLQTLEKEVKAKGGDIILRKETIPTGVIHTPTAQEIAFKNLPEKKKEGIKAMKETLDNDPAMQAHRKLVEDLKKSNEVPAIV
jgi:hypothetical protein